MTLLLYFIKLKLGLVREIEPWKEIIRIEKWRQYQYASEIHTEAGFEQMQINKEVKEKVPIHLSKLYRDWYLREDYNTRKQEVLQEM